MTDLTFETVPLAFAKPSEPDTPVTITVIGERVAPGLAITPMLGADEDGKVFYLGGFQLVHTSSGRAISNGQLVTCLGCVERYAKTVTALGMDWTQTAEAVSEQIKADPALTSALGEANIALFGCEEAECATSQYADDEPEPMAVA